MFDLLTLGVIVSVRRSGDVIAEDVGVERPARVYVSFTEIRFSQRIRLGRYLAGCQHAPNTAAARKRRSTANTYDRRIVISPYLLFLEDCVKRK